jgi:hypothetical protein
LWDISPRDIGTTPRGTRRYYPAIGGSSEGPRLRGEVLPDGGNRLLIRPDGVLEQEVRITLKTDDDAFIYVRSTFDMSEYGTDRRREVLAEHGSLLDLQDIASWAASYAC